MYVGCWDCGKPQKKFVERPRSVKYGWKNTVDVCKDCKDKWLKKHPEVKPNSSPK